MTFDEQLSRAADALTGRLRDEIAQHVQAATASLAEIARVDREQAALDARTAAEHHASEQIAAAVADAEKRAFAFGQESGVEEGRAAGSENAANAMARLADALCTLDAARTLSAVLDTLTASAASEAGRAAVLLVRGDRAQMWRQVGFIDPSQPSSQLEFAIGEQDIVGAAAIHNTVVTARNEASPNTPPFAGSSWSECVCVPVALAGEVVAVLYADTNDEPAPAAWRQRVELLVRHATRCLEALIAFKAARMLATPSRTDSAATASDATADDEVGARRYARLLVSEIRLYHEDAVAAGRRERDLATRLGGEIARARVLYEQRVAPRVRQRADYFQDELVRTLADGDPALLELRT